MRRPFCCRKCQRARDLGRVEVWVVLLLFFTGRTQGRVGSGNCIVVEAVLIGSICAR